MTDLTYLHKCIASQGLAISEIGLALEILSEQLESTFPSRERQQLQQHLDALAKASSNSLEAYLESIRQLGILKVPGANQVN